MLLYKLIFKLLLDPLPETKNGYKYYFTKYVELEAEDG